MVMARKANRYRKGGVSRWRSVRLVKIFIRLDPKDVGKFPRFTAIPQ